MVSALFVLFFGTFAVVSGQEHHDLECHACYYTYHPTANDDCVRNPDALNYTVWCDSTERRCFEQRQFDIANGYIRTFSRGCEVITREDGCVTDQYYEDCLYTCDSRRCNDNDRSLGPPPTTPPPVSTTTKVKDLTCYSCQYGYHPEADATCVTSPEDLPPTSRVECSSEERECFVYMQYDNFANHVRSMTRGCEVLDDVEEGCVEDIYFTTCWTKCSDDLCNDGNGWPEDTDNNGDDGDGAQWVNSSVAIITIAASVVIAAMQ